ncbi:MAG: hypothetical protein HYR55_07030 [Acidobacteria bacterium]|nr:hypothetical protein [Acidobacteriota bacterium]MBI3656232.1 hypothetical protein [Acidobacteriota bacterium]
MRSKPILACIVTVMLSICTFSQNLVYVNTFDQGATTTPQYLRDLQPAWTCKGPRDVCGLGVYSEGLIVDIGPPFNGVLYEKICTRRDSCGTVYSIDPNYTWTTLVNQWYSKNLFGRIVFPAQLGKFHNEVDSLTSELTSFIDQAGITLTLCGNSNSCNFGQPNCASDTSCASAATCLTKDTPTGPQPRWFWMTLYYEVRSNSISATGELYRCDTQVDLSTGKVPCDNIPLVRVSNTTTDASCINGLVNQRTGDFVYPFMADPPPPNQDKHVSEEDYVEVYTGLLSGTAPSSPLRGRARIVGPSYITFR